MPKSLSFLFAVFGAALGACACTPVAGDRRDAVPRRRMGNAPVRRRFSPDAELRVLRPQAAASVLADQPDVDGQPGSANSPGGWSGRSARSRRLSRRARLRGGSGRIRPELRLRAMVALASFPIFMVYGSATMFDALLSFTVVLGIGMIWRIGQGDADTRLWVWLGVVVGVGVLAKGPVVLVHLLPALLSMRFWAVCAPNAAEWSAGICAGVARGAWAGRAVAGAGAGHRGRSVSTRVALDADRSAGDRRSGARATVLVPSGFAAGHRLSLGLVAVGSGGRCLQS